jgi:hypothetical protein
MNPSVPIPTPLAPASETVSLLRGKEREHPPLSTPETKQKRFVAERADRLSF